MPHGKHAHSHRRTKGREPPWWAWTQDNDDTKRAFSAGRNFERARLRGALEDQLRNLRPFEKENPE